jgi:hypothetical protein
MHCPPLGSAAKLKLLSWRETEKGPLPVVAPTSWYPLHIRWMNEWTDCRTWMFEINGMDNHPPKIPYKSGYWNQRKGCRAGWILQRQMLGLQDVPYGRTPEMGRNWDCVSVNLVGSSGLSICIHGVLLWTRIAWPIHLCLSAIRCRSSWQVQQEENEMPF